MKLSVVIPCFNAGNVLGEQLEALAKQRWDQLWEIIVADNASTDDSATVVEHYRQRMGKLRLVKAGGVPGVAHARNRGAAAARGECLAFCDADDVAGEGWVAAMGEALETHAFVACRHDFEKLNPPELVRSRVNPQRDGLQKYDYPPFLPFAGGCGLGIRRELHEAINGFDETLPACEDADYCWRLQLAGAPLHFAGEAVMHVRLRDSVSGIFRQARRWGEYNVVLYKRFRQRGMPRLSWRQGAHRWWRLIKRLPKLRRREGRIVWIWSLGLRLGRLMGCIKHRVIAL